jgi:mannose-6-phosphate isomerase-like protein (cupin superfamily)
VARAGCPSVVDELLGLARLHLPALLRAEPSALPAPPFMGCELHRSPTGSTVMAMRLDAGTLAAMPPGHRWLDFFLLDAHARLGTHFHRRASAHIHVLSGEGALEVDGQEAPIAAGATGWFPAGSRHDVRAYGGPVLFASFQDHPIIQPDGSLDYFTDAPQPGATGAA